MTNAETTLKALQDLEAATIRKLVSAHDVMWQIRRNGWQITTDKTRNVLKHLARTGQIECIRDGRRYYFRTVKP